MIDSNVNLDELDTENMSLMDLTDLNLRLVEAIINKNRELVQKVEDLTITNQQLKLESNDDYKCVMLKKKLEIATHALKTIATSTLYKEWKSIMAQNALNEIEKGEFNDHTN